MTTRLLASLAAAATLACLSAGPLPRPRRTGRPAALDQHRQPHQRDDPRVLHDRCRYPRLGDDRLGQNVVEPGQALRVVPTPRQRSRGYCQFDMKVVFDNERTVERRAVNLCSTSNLVCNSTSSCSAN